MSLYLSLGSSFIKENIDVTRLV